MKPVLRLTAIRPRTGDTVVSRRAVLASAAALTAACAADGKQTDDAPDSAGPVDTGIEAAPIPAITANEDFYVTSISSPPEVDLESWTLSIIDRGVVVQVLTRAVLLSLPARDKEHTLMCIGGGPRNLAIGNAVWSGLPVTEMFEILGIPIPEDVVEIKFSGADGYTTSVPLSDLHDEGLHGPLWLVWRMNGADLPAEHGTVCRFLTPGRYGQKNPKWPISIEFVAEPYIGFWESLGWSNDASYAATGLMLQPASYTTVPVGPAVVQGVGFAGKDPIVAVNLRIDRGDWRPATLTYSPGADIWTVWSFDYDVLEGEHTLQVQSLTASGATSNDDPNGTGSGDGYDGSMEITVNGV